MFCCLTLICVVVRLSREDWLSLRLSPQYFIYNLTQDKLKLKNTKVNNCILENIHIVLPLYHTTSTLIMTTE